MKKAFTLLEVLSVILILGIIASFSLSSIPLKNLTKVDDVGISSDMRNILLMEEAVFKKFGTYFVTQHNCFSNIIDYDYCKKNSSGYLPDNHVTYKNSAGTSITEVIKIPVSFEDVIYYVSSVNCSDNRNAVQITAKVINASSNYYFYYDSCKDSQIHRISNATDTEISFL